MNTVLIARFEKSLYDFTFRKISALVYIKISIILCKINPCNLSVSIENSLFKSKIRLVIIIHLCDHVAHDPTQTNSTS